MKKEIKWQKKLDNSLITVVPKIGTYQVKRLPRSSTWVALRNGEPTTLQEDSLAAIMNAVENVIKAVLERK